MFQRARRAGLRRTAHSETGPPRNVVTLLDDLACERVDHGYHVLDRPAVLRLCLDEHIPFTCTPVGSDLLGFSGPGDGKHERIGTVIESGLDVAIDSDDPPMFHTYPTADLVVLARARGYSLDAVIALIRSAAAASFMDGTERARFCAALEAASSALR